MFHNKILEDPLVILGILVVISIILMIILVFVGNSVINTQKKKCLNGPAFYCANKDNWDLCNSNSDRKYADFCCDTNAKWMDNIGTKDPDPNTNGFLKQCKGSKPKKCSGGRSVWCANKDNWEVCNNDKDMKFDDYCGILKPTKCAIGPDFWCDNEDNWNSCVSNKSGKKYKDYCLKKKK